MSSGESGSTEEGEKKQVTVKGIDKELYERAVQMSREMGVTVGELINRSLRAFISLVDVTNKAVSTALQTVTDSGRAFVEGVRNVRVISNIDELTVSRSDLESVDFQVSFRNIKRLVFSEDVTWDLFNDKVYSIVMCDEVVLPKSIPKLKAIEKMRFVKKISTS